MTQSTRRPALAGSLILIAAMASSGAALAQSPAAGSPASAPAAPTGVSGSIAISGSSTVQPITALVQELFNAGSPDVAITVDGPGTGDGFALFCAGQIDIADASRSIKDAEKQTCTDGGINYIELKVANDGLAVITSSLNDAVTCLSFDDLYALLGPESQGFSNWKDAQAIATALGSTTTFPDAPLTITGPGEESGTYDFMNSIVIAPIATARGITDATQAAVRPDYQSSPDDNAIIAGVAGSTDNATTLGWVGFAYVEENLDKVKPLAVDGGKGCVDNDRANIADGGYPISRPLFIYVNTDKAAANPAVTAFVDYYLTPGVVDAVLQTVPYVALPADQFQATIDAWKAH